MGVLIPKRKEGQKICRVYLLTTSMKTRKWKNLSAFASPSTIKKIEKLPISGTFSILYYYSIQSKRLQVNCIKYFINCRYILHTPLVHTYNEKRWARLRHYSYNLGRSPFISAMLQIISFPNPPQNAQQKCRYTPIIGANCFFQYWRTKCGLLTTTLGYNDE